MRKEQPQSDQLAGHARELSQSAEDTLDAYLSVVERIQRYISADPQRLKRFQKALTQAQRRVR